MVYKIRVDILAVALNTTVWMESVHRHKSGGAILYAKTGKSLMIALIDKWTTIIKCNNTCLIRLNFEKNTIVYTHRIIR